MMESDVERIINQWYNIASTGSIPADDIFLRFVAVWVAFNALYSYRFPDYEGDKKQVMAFARSQSAKSEHIKLLKNSLYLQSVLDLQNAKVINVQDGNVCIIHNIEKLDQVANCFYQVRNNLFHGSKGYGNSRNKMLVLASHEIVKSLIAPFITKT